MQIVYLIASDLEHSQFTRLCKIVEYSWMASFWKGVLFAHRLVIGSTLLCPGLDINSLAPEKF